MSEPIVGAEKRRSDSLNTMRASTSALQRPDTNIVDAGTGLRLVTGGSRSPFAEDEAQTGSPSRHSYAAYAVRPGSRESFKENMAPVDADEYEKYRREIEVLKAEIGTLQYRIQITEQEREIQVSLQNSKLEQCSRREMQEAQSRQAADAAASRMTEKANALQQELESFKEAAQQKQDALGLKARDASNEAQLLREELNTVTASKDEALKLAERQQADLERQISGCKQAMEELEFRLKLKDQNEELMQRQSTEKDELVARLEAENIRFKARSDDMETIELIKEQLSEQVQHINALESTNRHQSIELERFQTVHKAVEVVEEEKQSLQRKLRIYEGLEAELAESRLQRRRLEQERLAWASYLEAAADNEHEHFDSPIDVARALTKERLTTTSYVEQLGALRAELIASQGQFEELAEENAQLRKELETMKSAEHEVKIDRVRIRLDRQRILALKEAEFLRAQLKIVDDAEETCQPETFDEKHALRVRELESLIEDYKAEVQKLHQELSSNEISQDTEISTVSGNKRPCPDDPDDHGQVGQLLRKNRTLQDDLTKVQMSASLVEKDLSACREQLAVAQELNRTRILSLKSNPTSDYEAMRRCAVDALQKENRDLLTKLRSTQSDPSIPLVPTSVLNAMEREIAAAKAETASAQKSSRRLKEVWASKSQEFKEGISSTLGWTVTFIPNGKMRVESTFFPSQTDEHENSIVFDGERGTMKVGGGPKSAFARRISDQIGFWVREKGCVPGFLAALTLEFYEEHSRASKG